MAWSTMVAIYFLIWWTVLFAVLPWGITSQHETGQFVQGTDPGAPTVTGFRVKLLWTTLISAVIFAGFYVVYANQLVTLEDLATLWGLLAPHR